MAKVSGYYRLHPAIYNISYSYIAGVNAFKMASDMYENTSFGFDEMRGKSTNYKTIDDIADNNSIDGNKAIYNRIISSLEGYVEDYLQKDVWDKVINKKKYKDMDYPDAVRDGVKKWVYGFAKEQGLITISPNQDLS